MARPGRIDIPHLDDVVRHETGRAKGPGKSFWGCVIQFERATATAAQRPQGASIGGT
jgi:hypothetical protein